MDKQQLDPGASALVVIDLQNDFCHPEGAYARRGIRYTPPLEQTLANLHRLVGAARAAHVPVFFMRMENSSWADSPPTRARRGRHGRDPDAPPTCPEGSWGAGLYGVAPSPDDRVMVKHRYSSFIGTALDTYLRSLERCTVVVAGLVTNVCVESTARDAFMRDYWTVTVGDCCTAGSRAEHEGALSNLDRYFGEVLTLDELLQHWPAATRADAPAS
ncbi:MAG TPA: cysteine hydrolase [Gammaproteobacteria bacterium]|nr:cysteine hydrolase [Gammaproteobacteria bacterium]